MIAILSDIHANLPALQAVLASALDKGCDRFVSLGDVGGYGAQPGECIDLLIAHDAIHLMGNHDEYLVEGVDCPRSKVVSQIIDYQRQVITKDQLEWLSRSPSELKLGVDYFVHGGVKNHIDQYLYKVSAKDIPDDARFMFSGHTHVQVLARFGNQSYCNPGSVGQPRDGDSRAAYAILDDDDISLQRIEYDIDETVSAMKAAGFESYMYENLYIGAQIGGRIDTVKI